MFENRTFLRRFGSGAARPSAVAAWGLLWVATAAMAQQPWVRTEVNGPDPRNLHGLTFDSQRGVVVLFGGCCESDGTDYQDTWEWDGCRWHLRSRSGPPEREIIPMVFDSDRGVTVMHGGFSNAGTLTDTWEWDGTTWTEVSTEGPPERVRHSMAYDAGRGVVVLHGGVRGNFHFPDTWEWDGTTWTEVVGAGGPPRSIHGMTYDSARGKVVLYGGRDSTGLVGDTWEFDGTTWTQVSTEGPPARTAFNAIVFDESRGVSVQFGGRSPVFGDTWEWDGVSWTEVTPEFSPPDRSGHAMAYDTVRDVAVMFGGFNGPRFGDTWEFGFADFDFDTLRDCDDNCPRVSNLEQEDADRDFLGDACDPSLDAGVVALTPFNMSGIAGERFFYRFRLVNNTAQEMDVVLRFSLRDPEGNTEDIEASQTCIDANPITFPTSAFLKKDTNCFVEIPAGSTAGTYRLSARLENLDGSLVSSDSYNIEVVD